MRYLKRQEKTRTLPFWREAFPEDSEEFLEYYYTEKTADNRILAEEEEGRIVSMLHRNPYPVWAGSRRWNSDYVVAVATARDRRGRGLMRRLLGSALADMFQEGMEFCFLMPADRRLYEPFGFAYVYDQPHLALTPEAESILPTVGAILASAASGELSGDPLKAEILGLGVETVNKII